MSTIEGFFRERGVELDEALVVEALGALLDGRVTPGGAVALSGPDAELLARHGGFGGDVEPGASATSTAATAASVTALVAGSATVGEVAERAGVSDSRVRHWIGDGAVHVVRVGGRNHLPEWQFGPDGRPLPHLGEVLAVLPDDLHPLSVAGFFRTPQPELDLDGRTLSAAQWLLAGGPADPVVALAEAVGVLL